MLQAGHLGVLRLDALFGLVDRQQDVGVAEPMSRRLAGADQSLQTLAFLGFQPDDVSLHADPP